MVLETIASGYVLPLMSEPAPYPHRNLASALLAKEFVQRSVTELMLGGCMHEVPLQPQICSLLSVVESGSGKKRLVINLRHLNRYLWKKKFKYEDLKVVMQMLDKGDFLFSFDLKSGTTMSI